MRILFRALAAVVLIGFVLNLSLAQKSLKEIPDSEHGKLTKDGTRESHQGPDNPRQGSVSGREGRWGGPDVYGPEDYRAYMERNERQLHDPQWQLGIDLQDPKRIVIDYPDGSSQEYWYVLFRVVNNNVRAVRRTTPATLNPIDSNPNSKPSTLSTTGGPTSDMEGVPVSTNLDFELQVFTRDIHRDPWDNAYPEDPEDGVLSPEALAARRANMMKSYRAISDPYVLQRIAEREEMWEWLGNSAGSTDPITLLHPMSDFQRQLGRAHELSAPDLSGPRCLPYRVFVDVDGTREESTRYVAVYGDGTFAGMFGPEDELPAGAELVSSPEHGMWGKLTIRRYEVGDCIDMYGRRLRPNDPGYLNARTAGSGGNNSYGLIGEGHPAVGQAAQVPHLRLYQVGDKVLFNFNTGLSVPGSPNDQYRLNGKIVGPADPRFGDAEALDGSTEMFGGNVVGKPVKLLDSRGRALVRSLVTYQPGDVLTQAEWDIYRRQLGPGILARYENVDTIVGRPLTAADPVVGMPRIKLGHFVGPAERAAAETIQRGRDTGRRDATGGVILETEEYATGRPYNARVISPEDFMRDPDGTYTTNRVAPVPAGARLNPGEEYAYAPLGAAGENAVPVPKFDVHGAWQDYRDEFSGARIPLTDENGELVRDELDQIQYAKDYEYEYLYMYEFAPVADTDAGYRGNYRTDQWKLIQERIRMTFKDGAAVAPLARLVHRERSVSVPEVVDGYELNTNGAMSLVTLEEWKAANNGAEPGPGVVAVKILRSRKELEKVVVGVFVDGMELKEGESAENWDEAQARVEGDGMTVQEVEVIRYVKNFRDAKTAGGADPSLSDSDFESGEEGGNELEGKHQVWRRWTVPPPLVYRDAESDEWQVITRLADKIGPATRWDGADAPRFTTRLISEMWGVAVFPKVSADWDWANVVVRGLRGHVARAGLSPDEQVTERPNPADGGASSASRAFFNPRFVGEEWVYRVRYERLGDEFEAFRDLVRRQRTFWYRESDAEIKTRE